MPSAAAAALVRRRRGLLVGRAGSSLLRTDPVLLSVLGADLLAGCGEQERCLRVAFGDHLGFVGGEVEPFRGLHLVDHQTVSLRVKASGPVVNSYTLLLATSMYR